jgi:hypothetical protein
MRGLVGLFIVVAFGCHAQPADETEDVCTIGCRCVSAVPGVQEQCTAACTQSGRTFPDACITCVFENAASCSVINSECEQLCLDQQPPMEGRTTWP